MEIFSEINISRLKLHTNIREIYLFGSVARGDNDENSDIDILIVIDDCDEDTYVSCKKTFAKLLDVPVSWISLYRAEKISRMHEIGSYFLWHIKKEGKKIYSRDNSLEMMLLDLPTYKNVYKDLTEYSIILNDIKAAITREFVSLEYELAILASLVRNTCIAISYMDGKMDFGRESVVEYCIANYPLNISMNEYKNLYQYRLYHSGKTDHVSPPNLEILTMWLDITEQLLTIAKNKESNYETKII